VASTPAWRIINLLVLGWVSAVCRHQKPQLEPFDLPIQEIFQDASRPPTSVTSSVTWLLDSRPCVLSNKRVCCNEMAIVHFMEIRSSKYFEVTTLSHMMSSVTWSFNLHPHLLCHKTKPKVDPIICCWNMAVWISSRKTVLRTKVGC